MISIVLVEPELSGNLGAVARVMANFDLEKLVLINPKCKINQEARNRAKHAQTVLDKVKILKTFDQLTKKFDYVIGTTALIGSDYNIPRSPLNPEQMCDKIINLENKNKKNKTKIALVFGREGHGLFNTEVGKCDFIVTIPSSHKYYTLNLSHAASVIFYELFKKLNEQTDKKNRIESRIVFAGKKEKSELMKHINKILKSFKFTTKTKEDTQRKLWKNILGKAMLTKREAFALFGFFRKIKK